MKTIALKFGGSSLATAAQFEKVRNIIEKDPARRYVVASAPGKRNSADTKVTDLLYLCYELAVLKENFESALGKIRDRFQDIITELNISFDLDPEIEIIRAHLQGTPSRDYLASRGEYLNSKILAAYLGYEFVDPAECIFFAENGRFNAEKTNYVLRAVLETREKAVIAGFYGALPDGTVHTFTRGGSDVSGAIVARAVRADVYENWTDVSGMLVTDPRIVDDPKPIKYITYRELRELSYMGASVLHEDAVFSVRKANIPINIRNTNAPEDEGTWIVPHQSDSDQPGMITGIAGRKGFSSLFVEKSMMNQEVGFAAKLLQIIASYGISFEHVPSGIDTMSVIVNATDLDAHRDEVMKDIEMSLKPDTVSVVDHIALIAVVGHGMARSKGLAARIFSAIAKADINIRMIDQGSSELNIIIGVDEEDYEKAIRSIYEELKDGIK